MTVVVDPIRTIMDRDSTVDEFFEAVGMLTDSEIREMGEDTRDILIDRLYDIAWAVKFGQQHGLTLEPPP